MKRPRSFTLIETLLVVALIIILLSIVVAAYETLSYRVWVITMVAPMYQKLDQAIADGKMTAKSYASEKARIDRILDKALKRKGW